MDTLAELRAGRLAGATRLDLSCGLTEFPREIFDLADSLEILNLSGNALDSLPDDLHRLRRLRVLFCSDNRFTRLPESIGQCQTLPLNVQAASARAALAAQNVGDGVIRAPFAGVVTERYVEVGQFVRQDSRVVTIVSADPLRLQITVPEAQVANVKEGADVSFTVSAYTDRRFQGKVRFVSGALRATTRDLVAEAIVPNSERLLMPGMFADVELTVGSQRLPSVAARSINERDDQSRVFAVVAGRLEERVVAVGPKLGERVAITRGVKEGDQVVVSDLTGLGNGRKVK